MARGGDVLLDQHRVVAEGGPRLAARRAERPARSRRRASTRRIPLPPPPATALISTGQPISAARSARKPSSWSRAVVARHHRHPGLRHQPLRRVLQPHRPDRAGGRPDEGEAGRRHRLDELGVLGEEAVARMDRLRPGRQRRRDDRVAAQVALRRRRRPDPHRRVGHRHVLRLRVGVGIDRDRRHPEPVRRRDHPAGDLAAVGDQDAVEHRAPSRGQRAATASSPEPARSKCRAIRQGTCAGKTPRAVLRDVPRRQEAVTSRVAGQRPELGRRRPGEARACSATPAPAPSPHRSGR